MDKVRFIRIGERAVDARPPADAPLWPEIEVPGRALGIVVEAAHMVQRVEYIGSGRVPRYFDERVPERYWLAYVAEESSK